MGKVEIKSDELKENLRTAANKSPQGHNPYQHPNEWAEHFATNASAGIISTFNKAFEQFNKSMNPATIETPINKFFIEFKKLFDENLKLSFSTLIAIERRSKLLWWKETLYSHSFKRSYRRIDKYLLPIIMGKDLNDQIPEVTPISVDFLLRDTLYLLNDKKDDSVKFLDYLNVISNSKLKLELKSYFSNTKNSNGRISITDFIVLLINDGLSIDDFKYRTGIDPNEEITFGELSVLVLHDLLTQRLVAD